MKVFFTIFFCTLSLFLCAQQKAHVKKPVIKKSIEVKKAEETKAETKAEEPKAEVIKTEANKLAVISSRVVDEKGNPIGNVLVDVIDDSTGLVIDSTRSHSTGLSTISLAPGKKYNFFFSKPNYFFQFASLVVPDTTGYEKDLKDILLQKLEIGKKIILNSVFFEPNQSTLRKESFLGIERIIKLMNDFPSLWIEISGHTDNVGSLSYNRQFSEQRAKAIFDNLISKSADKNRLSFKGFGSSQPFTTNNTDAGRKSNSRIEIRIVKVELPVEVVEEVKVVKDTTEAIVKTDETSLVQHSYIYHSALKKEENTDSNGAEHTQENKDATKTPVKNVENTDSSKVTQLIENKDTTSTVKENKDTTIIVKQAAKVDSTIVEHHEIKDTIVTAVVKTEEIPVVHSLKMEIKNVGKQINSAYADYTPLLSGDGHMLIFTSRRPLTKKEVQKGKEGLEKVYVTYFDDKNEKWLEPKLLGPSINLPDVNNSAISLSTDGQHLLIYHAGTDINGNGDIFESQLFTEEWSEPTRLPSTINSEDNETSANISPDGRTIYFVSDRKGGLGGKDIWYSTQDDKGQWGEAKNLGKEVNSAEDEESVFIHPTGNAIFFSSKGHNTLGGYDIFMSVYDEITKKWSKAENLGAPINTPQDDISFILDANGKTGHYASSKPGGYGGLDIYSVSLFDDIMKANAILLQGRVVNKNGNSVAALISIKNKTTGQLSEPIKSNKITGQYFISLAPGKKYEIKVTAYGYNSHTETFEIPYRALSEEIFKDIVLESKNAFISSRVIDEKGNPIRNTLIEIVDKATNQIVAQPKSNSAGYSIISVPFGKTYDVVFYKSGYLFQSANAVIPDSVGYEKDLKDITLQKVEVGKKIVLNSIFFELNQPTLKKESILELKRVMKLMSEMATLQVEMSGHTDNVGAIVYKKQLSEQRAKAVVDNLIVKGVDKNRLKYIGLGPTQPIAINFTEEGRQLNNRIELKVLKVDLIAEQIAEAKRVKEAALTPEKTEEEQKEVIAAIEKKDDSFEPTDEFKIMEVKNLGKQLNSLFADYAPLISADGHTLTFTSRRPLTEKAIKKGKEGLENIYVAYFDDKNDKWLEPKILGPNVNLPGINNSALALPNDGQQMLAYHCGAEPTATGDIFEHLIYGKEWTTPVRALPKPINSEDNETSVTISPDGRTIYFVSDRKDGLGGKDIWYAVQDEDGIFGDAINMGPTINTEGDEECVFMHPNGNILFFSSKDHNAMGAYDIFMSVFDETTGKWMKPENLGLPINTYGNDMYFTLSPNGKMAYYASSKPGKLGDLDINSIEFSEDIIKKNTTLLKGHILNKNNNPVGTMIVIKNKTTGKILDTVMSNKGTGKYFIQLISGKKYEIEYSAYGYSSHTEPFDIQYKSGFQKITKEIILESNSAFIFSRVLDDRGYPLSGVQVKIVDDVTSAVVAKPFSDSTGYTNIAVPYGKTYNIVFGKPGYFFQSLTVEIPDSVGVERDLKDIILQKVETGKKVVLNPEFFDLNQPALRKESVAELQRVVKLMNETVSLQIEISGHTDSIGTLKSSQKLSEQKAKIVMDSLIRRGADKNRLKYKGYGPSDPVASNSTAEGRKQNNRIEIKVLKIDLAAEQLAEQERLKESQLIPVKKDKNLSPSPSPIGDGGRGHAPPLSERLKKYDKDANGVISYEELLSAIDSTRTELNKVLKPGATPEKVAEEKPMKDTVVAPVKKIEIINRVKEGNKDTIATVIKKDSISNPIPEQHVQGNKDTLTSAVKKDSTTNTTPNTTAEVHPSGNKDSVSIKKEETVNKEPVQVQKVSSGKRPIPERFKKFDKDNNGLISYDEILRVIDSFLDEDPKAKGDQKKDTTIAELLDYYFEQ